MPKQNKKKKNPPTPFGMYLRERRRKLESERYVFLSGDKDILDVCLQEWKNLTPEEQEPYKIQAKEEKEERKKDMTQKFTSTGESYAEINERRMADQNARQGFEKLIDDLTVHSTIPQAERHFIVIKTIHSCIEHNTQTYWPSELAVAVFNLKEGVKCTFSTLINTKLIPPGYTIDVMDNCDLTGLPQPDSSDQAKHFEPEHTDYLQIIRKIRQLVEKYLDDYPRDFVLFAISDKEVKSAEGCLQWLFDNAKQSMTEVEIPGWQNFFDHLRFYPLPRLVVRLAYIAKSITREYENAMAKFPDLYQAAEALLNQTTFRYRSVISCSHHTQEAYCHKIDECCQNIALRNVYMIVNHFVKPFKLEIHDGHDIGNFSKLFPSARRPRPPSGNTSSDHKGASRHSAKDSSTNATPAELETIWVSGKSGTQPTPSTNPVAGAAGIWPMGHDTPAPSAGFIIRAPISSAPSASGPAPQNPQFNPGPGRGRGLAPRLDKVIPSFAGTERGIGRGHGQSRRDPEGPGPSGLRRPGVGRGAGR